MKKLCIDIDGVACDHAYSLCNIVNKEYNLHSKPENIVEWDYNFGPITFVEACKKYYSIPEFILNMKVTDGFIHFLNHATKHFDVFFATHRNTSQQETREWIESNFGKYEVIFQKDKTTLDFDYLIDDHPETIEKAAKKDSIIMAFVITRPWNKSYQFKHINIHRINMFMEIFEKL